MKMWPGQRLFSKSLPQTPGPASPCTSSRPPAKVRFYVPCPPLSRHRRDPRGGPPPAQAGWAAERSIDKGHYSCFDGTIGPYNFLRFSDELWGLVSPGLHYQNRLRRSDYLRLLEHVIAVKAD